MTVNGATVKRFFEANLVKVLRARARRAQGLPLPGAALETAVRRCLAGLRPRNGWPENTAAYEVIRAHLSAAPLATLAGFGMVAALVLYLGLGQTAVAWVGALLGRPGF